MDRHKLMLFYFNALLLLLLLGDTSVKYLRSNSLQQFMFWEHSLNCSNSRKLSAVVVVVVVVVVSK